MDAINLILFAVLFVLQVAILILLLRRRSGDAGHQTELLARQLQAQDNERRAQIERLEAAVQTLREDNYRQQVKLLELVQNQSDSQTRRLGAFMAEMQKSNEQKLDQMRQTVDEKLTGTQQLESVYKSLGEMQKLSSGVTESVNGLNRVLTNVKSRGTWAEVQLGNILDQTVPGMYDTNVATNPKYNGRVEFAVRIPAADGSGHAWLPIGAAVHFCPGDHALCGVVFGHRGAVCADSGQSQRTGGEAAAAGHFAGRAHHGDSAA